MSTVSSGKDEGYLKEKVYTFKEDTNSEHVGKVGFLGGEGIR